jgi:2,3-bisphosphoglycerate-dependent phosphoglycerate mutase
MSTLILLRHGQSHWNEENRFTGWWDVDLSRTGEAEARAAGELLRAEPGLRIDRAYTSVLTRAVRTCAITLDALDQSYVPVERHWRLNERHYGALQGLNKKETADKFGLDQVTVWRRSYDTPPDPVSLSDPNHPINDPRYRDVPPWVLPATECLKDVVARMLPYFEDRIAPHLIADETVFIAAHGNSLRALVKQLEHLSDDEIVRLEIPTGVPRVYTLSRSLEIEGYRELGDPAENAARAEAVARQAG